MTAPKVQPYCGTFFKTAKNSSKFDQNLSMHADDNQVYELDDNIRKVISNLNLNASKAS